MSFVISVLALVVVLGVLIFVHEAGHFLAAKAAGIHVHRFSLGMGSPIRRLSFTRNGTEYAISWLPLGGYVKMATAEEEATSSALEGDTPAVLVPPDQMFEAKPVWKRMVVILAGVTMNILLAWLVYAFLAAKNGERIDPTTTVGRVVTDSLPASAADLRTLQPGDQITEVSGRAVHSWDDILEAIGGAGGAELTITVLGRDRIVLPIPETALTERGQVLLALQPYRAAVVGEVLPGKPADRAGVMVGDTILAVNGDSVAQWYALVDRIRGSAGHQLGFLIGRKGQRSELRVTPDSEPEVGADGGTRQVGKVGIGPATDYRTEQYNLGQAILAGGKATLTASTQIVRVVRGLLTRRVPSRALGGPILIAQQAGQFARIGLDAFLGFLAFVSVNLAVLNLLPIPVLDGGQFIFLVAEAVLRRPLSLKLRERLTLAGLVLIAMLMTLAFSNDISRNWGTIVGFFRGLLGR